MKGIRLETVLLRRLRRRCLLSKRAPAGRHDPLRRPTIKMGIAWLYAGYPGLVKNGFAEKFEELSRQYPPVSTDVSKVRAGSRRRQLLYTPRSLR